jgi:GNAT superfamily N-acetyltransferase
MWNQGNLYLNNINWVHTLEEEGYISITSDIPIVIMIDDEDEEKYVSAGCIDVRVFDEHLGNIMHSADVDGDSYAIIETYLQSEKDYERIAVLNSIKIKEEYRRKGLASYVINKLHHFLSKVLYVDGVILIASPGHGGEGEKEIMQWLIRFYERFGYCPLIGELDNHLGLDLNRWD